MWTPIPHPSSATSPQVKDAIDNIEWCGTLMYIDNYKLYILWLFMILYDYLWLFIV